MNWARSARLRRFEIRRRNHQIPRLVAVAIVCLSVIPVAACQAYLPGCITKGGTTGTPSATVNVDHDWNPFTPGKFVPPSQTVRAGNLITWIFKDTGTLHSVTADNGSFDSCQIYGGPGLPKFTVSFNQPGTFKYHCRVHSGMRGEVKVI